MCTIWDRSKHDELHICFLLLAVISPYDFVLHLSFLSPLYHAWQYEVACFFRAMNYICLTFYVVLCWRVVSFVFSLHNSFPDVTYKCPPIDQFTASESRFLKYNNLLVYSIYNWLKSYFDLCIYMH